MRMGGFIGSHASTGTLSNAACTRLVSVGQKTCIKCPMTTAQKLNVSSRDFSANWIIAQVTASAISSAIQQRILMSIM